MSSRFTIDSSDKDELSAYFTERVSKVSISPLSGSQNVRISSRIVPLGDTVAFRSSLPSGAVFKQGEDLDGVFVVIPEGPGRAQWRIGDTTIDCNATAGYIGPMRDQDTMTCTAGWKQMIVKFSGASLNRCLSELLDGPILRSLEFAPLLDLTSKPEQAFAMLAGLAFSAAGATLSSSPAAAKRLSESLTIFALEQFQHSYSSLLANGKHALQPRHVKRALEFMEANAERPIALRDIAEASNVSVRALHYGFKEFVGETPLERLRLIRLTAVRNELLLAPPNVPIADIATKWGFMHTGRFADQFRQAFGVSPSAFRANRNG